MCPGIQLFQILILLKTGEFCITTIIKWVAEYSIVDGFSWWELLQRILVTLHLCNHCSIGIPNDSIKIEVELDRTRTCIGGLNAGTVSFRLRSCAVAVVGIQFKDPNNWDDAVLVWKQIADKYKGCYFAK